MIIEVLHDKTFPDFVEFSGYVGKKRVAFLQIQNNEVVFIEVPFKCRRNGYATNIYNFACDYLGRMLKPADMLNTSEAKGFWGRYGF